MKLSKAQEYALRRIGAASGEWLAVGRATSDKIHLSTVIALAGAGLIVVRWTEHEVTVRASFGWRTRSQCEAAATLTGEGRRVLDQLPQKGEAP